MIGSDWLVLCVDVLSYVLPHCCQNHLLQSLSAIRLGSGNLAQVAAFGSTQTCRSCGRSSLTHVFFNVFLFLLIQIFEIESVTKFQQNVELIWLYSRSILCNCELFTHPGPVRLRVGVTGFEPWLSGFTAASQCSGPRLRLPSYASVVGLSKEKLVRSRLYLPKIRQAFGTMDNIII